MAVLNVAALFSSRKEVCGSFAIWGEKNLDAHPPNSKGIHNRFPGGGLDKGRIAKLPRHFLFLRPDERNGEITCVQFLRSPHSPGLRAAQQIGRASCRASVGQYGYVLGAAVYITLKDK